MNIQNRHIEELSLNAWPSIKNIYYDGWLLRFSNGYTKRANSVNPIFDSTMDTEEKIERCEELYRQQNLPIVFKITPFVKPNNLDSVLEERGYERIDETSVRVLDNIEHTNEEEPFRFCSKEEWLDVYCKVNEEQDRPTLTSILEHIFPKTYFVTKDDIACVLGVLQNDHIGIFNLMVHKDHRRKGLGTALMNFLINSTPAEKAYLQVMVKNEPACSLYKKMGFMERYRYWYRIKKNP